MELRIDKVRKEFDRFPALHETSLDIRSGELIALLGPSGSGKTTLLRLIAGLEQPTDGAIFFGDEDASHRSVQDRNVGFVFQHYALFRHMTVLDNIAFGLNVRPAAIRPPKREIERRVLELLDLVQLPGLEKRYPNQLSGEADGPATLYFRPQDIEILTDTPGGGLAGPVAAQRRVAGTRHLELEIGGDRTRVEIEVPADYPIGETGRVAFKPKRWRLYRNAGASGN